MRPSRHVGETPFFPVHRDTQELFPRLYHLYIAMSQGMGQVGVHMG